MEKKKKLLEIYTEMSTPQELFLDTIERIEKTDASVEEFKTSILTTLENQLNQLDASSQTFTEEKLIPLLLKIEKVEGKLVAKKEILEMISRLIPPPIKGKDGTEITSREVRDRLKELKGKERLSVFDLKDTEWLRGQKEKIQWNSVGGLSLTSIHPQRGTIASLTTLNLSFPINITFSFIINGESLHFGTDFTHATGGTVITFTPALSSDFLGQVYNIVYA